ncbi:lipocalin family protein [Vibrio genomosp. F10 str. 9ZC157]|uniref:lipocalin family protein n=1 Tax=Vibrio genomosp. F10 TaxID=723171 RepID=UPI0002E6BE23|nr:lipocalin family protein [Vibrio genomosp. F10]OEE93275.1 lipocalin [Vibrio genomosp. F10 str. 9ZC157]
MKRQIIVLIISISSTLLVGCGSITRYLLPVEEFDIAAYLGTWYEVARLDHRFDQGLTHSRTQYTIDDDGSIKVVNSGWSEEDHQWKEAIGKAKLADDNTGHLHISFSGPFYGSYVVFYLEDDYSTAMVASGANEFWLLSRTNELPEYKMNKYLRIAKKAGFSTEQLVFPFEQTY